MTLETDLVEELKIWMFDTGLDDIDSILEFLTDKDCLNEKGKTFRHEFWERYIKAK